VFRRVSYALLILGLALALLLGTLWLGYALGLRHGVAPAPAPVAAGVEETQHTASLAEAAALREALADAQRGRVIAERTLQIDRETTRALQERLKEEQDARLALNREISYLKQLVQDGGRGALRAEDLRVTATEQPRIFRYGFTVTQLATGFGQASGRVRITFEGDDDSGRVRLTLADLPAAEPQVLNVALEHLQTLTGTFTLPEGFVPAAILIDVEPTDERLIETSERFPWTLFDGAPPLGLVREAPAETPD
jgi:hypothetical protein